MDDLKELTDKELAYLLMIKDKERKDCAEAEKLYWNCVKEINQRIDIEENNEPDEEDMWKFLDKVIEVCNGASRGVDLIFQCPICNNQAIAYIAPNNGHKHARCMSCGMEVSA